METAERTTAQQQGVAQGPFDALHHVALVTNDMKKTVAFYRDILGGAVVMAHRMPRPGNERHYFIRVSPSTVFAFFEFPDAVLPDHKGATLPSTGRAFDHVAFFAPSEEAFNEWYRRLGEANVQHLTPITTLGMGIRAFFFADPNGIVLEVMCPLPGVDPTRFPETTLLDDPDPAY